MEARPSRNPHGKLERKVETRFMEAVKFCFIVPEATRRLTELDGSLEVMKIQRTWNQCREGKGRSRVGLKTQKAKVKALDISLCRKLICGLRDHIVRFQQFP